MGIISRLKLDHPALGTAGGSSLHAAIETMFKKIGDMTNSRFSIVDNLNNGSTTTIEHNFQCAFDELKVILYAHNESTGELTRIVKGGSPNLDNFTIAATVGFTTTKIDITNNTGSQQDIAVVIVQGDFAETLAELDDVDLSTTPEDGQALVYLSSTSKFVPGASGDSSFKLQKIVGNTLTIKKGYFILDDRTELYSPSDLSADISALGNGNWYVYINRLSLPLPAVVSGRKLVEVSASNLVFSESTPDNVSTKYVYLGQAVKSGGVWSAPTTGATRRESVAIGMKATTLELTSDALDALLPITHSLGVVPEITFKVKNPSNKWEYHNAGDYFLATTTTIELADGSLVANLGSGVTVQLVYSDAVPYQFVPNKFWNSYVTAISQAVLVNDRAMFDTSAAIKTATLPGSPVCGDEVRFIDARGTFGTYALTLARNGKLINGSANDFDCDISGKEYRAIFVDDTYGWLVTFD